MRVIPLETIVGAYEIIEAARLDTQAWRTVHDRLSSYSSESLSIDAGTLFNTFLWSMVRENKYGAEAPGEKEQRQARLMCGYLMETYINRYGDPVELPDTRYGGERVWFDTAHIKEIVSEEAFPTHEERA